LLSVNYHGRSIAAMETGINNRATNIIVGKRRSGGNECCCIDTPPWHRHHSRGPARRGSPVGHTDAPNGRRHDPASASLFPKKPLRISYQACPRVPSSGPATLPPAIISQEVAPFAASWRRYIFRYRIPEKIDWIDFTSIT
jgi:hypothetical protein